MNTVGQKISDFELDAYHEEEIKKIKLSDYSGKWLVLLFYPADFTFICPTELGEAADLYPEFQKSDAEILSVSTDTVFSHKAWHDASAVIKKIKYPMLADPTGNLCRAFGTYLENEGLSFPISWKTHGSVSRLLGAPRWITREVRELNKLLADGTKIAPSDHQVSP